jgi:TRAP-type C4-dicarboxylate transport system permease small subunit
VFLHLLGRIALICLLLLVAMVLIVVGVVVAIQLFIFWIEHFTSGP